MSRWLLLLSLLPIVAGCASRYCERNEQVYEGSVEQAPLRSPEGLQVPPADPNFAIPEATGENVSYATPETDPKRAGRMRTRCLDAPPELPAVKPESEPAPELPAKPAAPKPG